IADCVDLICHQLHGFIASHQSKAFV
ncbi:unnamed protein product, partial [Allacma fusca]